MPESFKPGDLVEYNWTPDAADSWRRNIGAQGIIIKGGIEWTKVPDDASMIKVGGTTVWSSFDEPKWSLVEKGEDMACSVCGEKGHNSATCASRKTETLTAPEGIPIGSLIRYEPVPSREWSGAEGEFLGVVPGLPKLGYVKMIRGTSVGSDRWLESRIGPEDENAKLSIESMKVISAPTGEPEKKKLPPLWKIVEEVLPIARLTLFFGPPGTGKTTAGNLIGVKDILDDPEGKTQSVYNVTLTEETPSAELRGHYVPKGGEFIWMDGPALTAFRHGARLVLNEIDKASGDCLQFLHGLLDDPGISRLTLPTGETVYPNPNFTVVATMNGMPEDLPEALRDRFTVSFFIKKPHPDAIKSLPKDLQRPANKGISTEANRSVSMRGWKTFAELRDKLGEAMAAYAVWGDRAETILNSIKISEA